MRRLRRISGRLLRRRSLGPTLAFGLALLGVAAVLDPFGLEDLKGDAGRQATAQTASALDAARRLALRSHGALGRSQRAAAKTRAGAADKTTPLDRASGAHDQAPGAEKAPTRGRRSKPSSPRAATADHGRRDPARSRRATKQGSKKRASKRARAEAQAARRQARRAGEPDPLPPDGNEQLTESDNEATNEAAEGLEELDLGAVVDTPIVGKIMSHDNRAGVPGATVELLVYHPLSPVAGAPSWIVPITATTDGQGLFSAILPLPEVAPRGSPSVGLIASHGSSPALFGVPLTGLDAGRPENLGVFWLPGPAGIELRGVIAPASLGERAALRDTGGLNPLAWDERIRPQVLALFPRLEVPSDIFRLDLPAPSEAHGGDRWLALEQDGAFYGARPVSWQSQHVEQNGETRKEFWGEVEFRFGEGTLALSGSVVDANGSGVAGAVLTTTTLIPEPARTVVTDSAGFFRLEAPPPSLTALVVSHPTYLTQAYALNATSIAPTLRLDSLRPDIPLVLRDSVTSEPIRSASFTLFAAAPAEGNSPPQSTSLTLGSDTGDYRLGASFAVARVELSAEGYFPSSLEQPHNNPQAPLEVRMTPARVVTLSAREATARNDRWSDHDASSLVTYWGNRWLEFEIDHGADLAAFDFELGARNHGIIDHSYRFRVRVQLDGADLGELSILASQTQTVSERLALPPGDRIHTVRITWLNDRYIPQQLDANIIADWVKFHQRPLTPEEQGTAAPEGGAGG